jgi:methionyl-tRNA synthetase
MSQAIFARMWENSRIDNGSTDKQSAIELSRPAFVEEDRFMVEALEQLASRYDDHMSKFEVNRALECISEVLARSNEHFQTLAPWSREADGIVRQRAMYYGQETCRITALLARPIMPAKMQEMLNVLQDTTKQEWTDALTLRDRIIITPPKEKIAPLFPSTEKLHARNDRKESRSRRISTERNKRHTLDSTPGGALQPAV